MARLPVCLGVDGVFGAMRAPDPVVGPAEVGVAGRGVIGIADVAVGVKTTLIIESSSKTLGVGVGGGGAMTKLRRLFRAFFFWSAAARTVDPEKKQSDEVKF